MKLIRLVSDQEDGYFDCDFKEDLEIPKNAELALKNVSVELEIEQIKITSLNNEINFGYNAINHNALVPNGIYTATNHKTLMDNITISLNKSLSINTIEDIGMLWNAEVNNDNKVEISYEIVPYYLPNPTLGLNYIVSKNVNWAASVVSRSNTTGTDNTYDSFIAQTFPAPNTCSSIRIQLQTISNGVGGILVAGYMKEKPKADGSNIKEANIYFGIKLTDTQTFYIVNGVLTEYMQGGISFPPKGSASTTGDIFDIAISDGFLGNILYRADPLINTPIIINNLAYDYNEDLYSVLVFVATGINIKNTDAGKFLGFMVDPQYVSLTGTQHEQDLGANVKPKYQLLTERTNNNFVMNDSLADFLNFKNVYPPSTLSSDKLKFSYLGYSIFLTSIIPDSLIIELLNIELNSYDSFYGGRKNILAVIPNIENVNNRLIYNDAAPLFIEINNIQPRLLRNIRARLLNTDYSGLTIRGQNVITLILK